MAKKKVLPKRVIDDIGAPYLVVDDDGESQFTTEPQKVLKTVEEDLRDSTDVDGFKVAVYKLVEMLVYEEPKAKGQLLKAKGGKG